MNRVGGKRFDYEPKLNLKKVFATVIAIFVFIMVIISIINLFKKDKKNENNMEIPIRYFSIYESGKYGVIDGSGKMIINPIYDEMIIIPNNSKGLFICTYDVDYSSGTYKTKVLNEKNQELLKNYEKITPIENSDKKAIWYEDNILRFEKNGLYGLIDFSGKEIVPAEYDNIYALDGIQKSIVVEKEGIKGIVNSSLGTIVVNCEYNDIFSLNIDNADNGYIVKKDEKYGILSGTGKEILGCNYLEIKHVTGNNMYVVKDENNLKIIDNNLNIIKEEGFDDVTEINGEYITIEVNGLKGVINKNGEEIIPVQYEGLKYSCEKYFIAKSNGLYGIINVDNLVLIDFAYENISFINSANFYTAEKTNNTTDIISRQLEVKLSEVIISELNMDKLYMRVRQNGSYKYYNFNFEEKNNIDVLVGNTLFLVNKDGKYGYVNKNGELIVNYIYDDAREQNQFGYCVVKQNGLWGVLEKDGTVILKPSVNLDNNILIDFISSWHLYEDKDLKLFVK